MSFKIRANHERLFKVAPKKDVKQKVDDDDEVVFIIDEKTGQITEEKKIKEDVEDERETDNSSKTEVLQPKKESAKVFPLSMKNRASVSFM